MPTNPTTALAAETTGRTSPSKASFSMGGGSASMDFVIPRSGMGRLIQQILGSSEITAQGSLKRELPAAHPYYDWLYATRISNIEGLTLDGLAVADQYQRIIQTHFKDLAIYENYKVTVEFEPRPYILIPDDILKASWEANVPNYYNIANDFTTFLDCAEYRRFVEISLEPSGEFLTTAVNSFIYKNGDAAPTWINSTNGSGVNVLICKPTLKLTWYFVPYLMVFSRNIQNALGKVNQYPFYGYPAGSLLFKGVEINKYSPPYQTLAQGPGTGPEMTRMCDITFVFELFAQSVNDIATEEPLNPSTNFKKFYGHNLVIWAQNMKYYTAEISPERRGAGRPIYASYRMEQLFRYDA